MNSQLKGIIGMVANHYNINPNEVKVMSVNEASERMATIQDRREFSPNGFNPSKPTQLVYVVINPWDYTTASVIGIFSKESDAKACVNDLKANGDDSGNACPNVFYECSIIE